MKKLLLGSVLAIATIGTASAADMAVKAAARPACAAAQWSGGYVGIHGGSAYHSAYRQDQGTNILSGADEGNTLTTWGGAVGGQIGYNFVNCSTFWGIEVDGSWLSNDRFRRTSPLSTGPAAEIGGISSRLDGIVTARGRAGVALDNMLLYVTGGAAAIHTRTIYSHVHADNSTNYSASVDEWTWGWVAGFGSEWAFSPNWSLRSEFLYIGTADREYNRIATGIGAPVPPNAVFNQHDNIAVARVGLNYRFGGPR